MFFACGTSRKAEESTPDESAQPSTRQESVIMWLFSTYYCAENSTAIEEDCEMSLRFSNQREY